MEKQIKTRTLKIKGEQVEVSEEVYRAYIRPVRAEQRQKRREWKCKILSKNGNHYVRCNKSCEICPYYLSGKNALGNKLSLDKLADSGIEIEDRDMNLEIKYIEQTTDKEEYTKLHLAILSLNKRQQEMVRLIFFEGKSQEYVARLYGVNKQAISNAMQRIYDNLRKKIK